jgi:hypothetical protein
MAARSKIAEEFGILVLKAKARLAHSPSSTWRGGELL